MSKCAVLPLTALAAALLASSVHAEGPARRAGLWSLTISGGPMGGVHMESQTCIDPGREKGGGAVFTGPQRESGCTAAEVRPAPGGYAFHMVCKPDPELTMDTRGTATGDFKTSYTVKTTTRMTPAPMPQMAESTTTMTARWLGPCPAGFKPGETRVNGRAVPAGF